MGSVSALTKPVTRSEPDRTQQSLHPQLGAAQPLGLQLLVGGGQHGAHLERPVQLVQVRGPERLVDRSAHTRLRRRPHQQPQAGRQLGLGAIGERIFGAGAVHPGQLAPPLPVAPPVGAHRRRQLQELGRRVDVLGEHAQEILLAAGPPLGGRVGHRHGGVQLLGRGPVDVAQVAAGHQLVRPAQRQRAAGPDRAGAFAVAAHFLLGGHRLRRAPGGDARARLVEPLDAARDRQRQAAPAHGLALGGRGRTFR